MPETREIPLVADMRCWIRHDYPAGATPRLRPGALAIVLDPMAGDGLVEIECDGRPRLAAATDIDSGREYLTPHGDWISEGDPLFRDWAWRELRGIKTAATTSPEAAARVRYLAHLLERNDWSVPRWCRWSPMPL
ncbi:MAG: hypothetical protein EOP83_00440 [Verrucomicrobiaceae bacterium]|nr:MAG: hypothetical protein EOP83_00440 [Verrucomicrobiaceae bacterium]